MKTLHYSIIAVSMSLVLVAFLQPIHAQNSPDVNARNATLLVGFDLPSLQRCCESIAPAMYVTEPQSLVENLTQGNTMQFQLDIKPILKQSEIDNPHLVLQPTPCSLDYDIKSVGDGKITQDNGGKFIITLKASNYVPPGKYFVIISNNSYPTSTSEQYLDDIGGFVLNVVGK